MKKVIVAFAMIALTVFSYSFIYGQSENLTPTQKSVDEDVALNVKRESGDVKLNIQLKDITLYDHIVVERSAESPSYFGKCKYISCLGIKDGQIVEFDKYPYSATKDVYYRIKTVTKDGVERVYPAILLAAIAQ